MPSQVVVFQINNQSFGIDIKDVNEIINMQEITSIPKSSSHVEGITNLRGVICSVLNGHLLLGLDNSEVVEEPMIIVFDDGKVGMAVDHVSEIMLIEESDKKSFSGMLNLEKLGYIDYLVDKENQFITVLHLKKLLLSMVEPMESEAYETAEEVVA